MILPRKEFDDLICSIGTPAQQWDARFNLLITYDDMHARMEDAEAARNVAQLNVEELRENFRKQSDEVRGLHANLSYEKHTNKIIGTKLQTLERAEAVWIREASLLREALQKSTDAVIEAEAKAERYYRKVRELEIELRLSCKMEPPTTQEITAKEELSRAMNLLKRMRTVAVEHHEVGAIEKLSKIGWGDPCPVCDGTAIYTEIADAINAYNRRTETKP